MPTDTPGRQRQACEFALRAVAGSLGLLGLFRLSWTEAQVVLPLTRAQAGLANWLFGPPRLPVDVTLACSGADVLALCLGAILAYPVRWPARLAGAAGGILLIVALNVVRIGTLGLAVASPTWFDVLHVYFWPAVLTLAVAAYVFGWMRMSDRSAARDQRLEPGARSRVAAPQPTRRFLLLAAGFLVAFTAASPWYLESPAVLALAGFIARAASGLLGLFGVTAHASGNILWTLRGGFIVTQECIATPLTPIYLAAVCAWSPSWKRLVVGLLATLPLFTALGIARLLVVALPAALASSPLFLIHAFYQLLLAAVVVCLAAAWQHGGASAARPALAGFTVGALAVVLIAPAVARGVTGGYGGPVDDPQGALAFLPAFQVGLYLALLVATFGAAGWKRWLAGGAVLACSQIVGLTALRVLAMHGGFTAHVRDVRGWAIAGPLIVMAMVVNSGRPRH